MSRTRYATARSRYGPMLLLTATTFALVSCSASMAPPAPPPLASSRPIDAAMLDEPSAPGAETPLPGAQPQLPNDLTQLAQGLVADEDALHDPSTPETALVAAHEQQAAYRAIGRHPEWIAVTRSLMPPALIDTYDRNVDARRQLNAMARPKNTLPAWRIQAPSAPEELMSYYREAEAASGVGWNYLAAINLIETHFGSIDGVSTAGAQGPMQFMPSTFAGFGEGGDIRSPRDSIMAAGRYLAANGFSADRDHAIYRYNNADEYVRAVNDYAAALAADPAAFGAYYRWDVYYYTTSGDVLLPIGYVAASPVPVDDYLATHPQ